MTAVRQRITRAVKGRRGRGTDPTWANRRLLLRAGDTLSARALARLSATMVADDAAGEIFAAWAVEERLRQLLGVAVIGANMPETDRLRKTINTWWEAIEVLIVTGVTSARTEAANTTVKQIKLTGGGCRDPDHHCARILPADAARTNAARSAAWMPDQQRLPPRTAKSRSAHDAPQEPPRQARHSTPAIRLRRTRDTPQPGYAEPSR